MVSWRDVVSVAVGGALGTAGRAALTLAYGAALGPALVPLINVAGAFLIGILFGVRARMPRSSRAQRAQLFFGTGVLGGFTTYSSFMVDSVQLWDASPLLAAGYIVVSLAGGLAAAALGLLLGRKRAAS